MNFIPTLQNTGRFIAIVSCFFIVNEAAFAANTETPQTTVSLLFAGDIVLDGVPAQWIKDKKDPLAAYAAILSSTDISIGNLECVVATTGDKAEKIFTFRGHPSALPTIHQITDCP